jgi:hypothetical protein
MMADVLPKFQVTCEDTLFLFTFLRASNVLTLVALTGLYPEAGAARKLLVGGEQ